MLCSQRSRTSSGGTIAEALVAAACLAIFFVGLFALSSQSLKLLRSSSRQAAATYCLQQRVEEIRSLTWAQLTDNTTIRDSILANLPGDSTSVPGLSETITLNVYPTPTTATVFTRPYGGSASVSSTNPGLSSASMIRVDTLITWNKSNGGTNTREYTTVIANGGITQ
jgi:Tfp pilus assembly protein PilV